MSRVEWAGTYEEAAFLMEWAGDLIPHIGRDGGFDGPVRVAVVIGDPGNIMAVVVFHDWQDVAKTMQVSCAAASHHWASPEVLSELLAYVFDTNKTRKLWMAIPHTSENVIAFNKHLGFRQEAVLRQHFSDTDHAVILSMLEPEFRKSRWASTAPANKECLDG